MALLKLLSFVALLATLLPSILFLCGFVALNVASSLSLVATVAWFVVAPFWIGKPEHNLDDESPSI